MSFVQVSGLRHAYREGERLQAVLSEVSFAIERGERVALLGRSGSGKSTLLNLISGIDHADAGCVTMDGVELTALGERERTLFRRRHIGFVYQFFNLLPSLTALENVALVLELNGLPPAESAERAREMLVRAGLEARMDSFPPRLSGGEQQRVAIARALVHRPALVLADEPTGNLDARTGSVMLGELQSLAGDSGAALLLVTHSLAVARSATRILTLEDGRLTERDSHEFAW